jgi:hypothetical protein
MVSPRDLSDVRALMGEFADRTGLSTAATTPRRYLWTDAFAVCNFLSLFDVTRDAAYRELAIRLIDQVHGTLGRHRQDDARVGWISGLDEEAGRRHPTAGGLRIGKRLGERPAGEPINEREEWDRDGQYFHYLTKWMQALARAAVVTANASYCRFAIELAKIAHAAFTHEAPRGTKRMYWKMSIDLSRPLVASMGQHDPLDALVSYSTLENCRSAHRGDAGLPDLRSEIGEAAAMCADRDWITDDPLGIGGLLVDAYRISEIRRPDGAVARVSLNRLLTDARIGLARFAHTYPLDAPAERRLAFRELGLSIGLHAVAALQQRVIDGEVSLAGGAATELERLIGVVALAKQIETFWRKPANQSVATWREHLDINSVMLATSLLPRQFLVANV